jgi:DNA-binding winged helix-turn-helix (wHTH) protein
MPSLFHWSTSEGRWVNASFSKSKIVVGRSHGADFQVEDDFIEVSRVHAILDQTIGGWAITDAGSDGAGSTGGTWVNDQRLAANEPRLLQENDMIRLGLPKAGKAIVFNPPTTQAPDSVAARLFIDRERFRVLINGIVLPLNLAPQSFDVLAMLVEAGGVLVEHGELSQALWREPIDADNRNKINAIVKKLRTALATALGDNTPLVVSVPGRGYRLNC